MSSSKSYLPTVDAYIASAAPFAQPILRHLRELLHKAVPEIEEATKWSMPFFMLNGIILANMAAFKEHASFSLWNDKVRQVKKDGTEARGMGDFGKLRTVKDLPSEKELKALIVEAAERIASGERTKSWAGRGG